MRLPNLLSKFDPASSGNRILPMEGMRGFAAALVFFVHFRSLFGSYAEGSFLFAIVSTLGALGHAGVDLFFILSGYLVYGIVMSGRFNFWRFFVRRIQRLYPTFLVVLGLYLTMSRILPAHSKLPGTFPKAALYLAANVLMLPGVFHIKPIIAVAWSLSYEWCFYILLPLAVACLKVRKWSWTWRSAVFVALAAVCVFAASQWWISNCRYALFAAGILVWELLHNTRIADSLRAPGEMIAAALFTLNLLAIGVLRPNSGATALNLDTAPGLYTPSLFVTGFLITLYAISYKGFLARIFSWAPLRWMGNMSYSYYLIHGITLVGVQLVFRKLIHSSHLPVPFFLLLFLICFAATLLVSAELYLSIEWPLSLASSFRPPATNPKLEQVGVTPIVTEVAAES